MFAAVYTSVYLCTPLSSCFEFPREASEVRKQSNPRMMICRFGTAQAARSRTPQLNAQGARKRILRPASSYAIPSGRLKGLVSPTKVFFCCESYLALY